MNSFSIRLLLAEDDEDDCLFFEEALQELPFQVQLTTVHDGEQLMLYLENTAQELPTVVFLDLNMPRKNGFDCLKEIKTEDRLQHLPVIIYSTSLDQQTADELYALGAQHYIRKPTEFSKLVDVIRQALIFTAQTVVRQPDKTQFIIQI